MARHKAHESPSPWPRRIRRLHHALAAATLASAMLALEYVGWLEWLDAVMLSIVGSATSQEREAPDVPQVVLIDRAAYATAFGARSPLDRGQLARVLADVLEGRPRTLLVDVQIEPVDAGSIDDELDRLLKRATVSTRVVLPIPQPLTPQADAVSLRWMQSMCQGGVRFGDAYLVSHFGTVVRISRDPRTLVAVAALDPSARALEVDACRQALASVPLDRLVAHGAARRLRADDSTPLAPQAVTTALKEGIAWAPESTAMALRKLAPPTVVVGGSYDTRDAFLTYAGRDAASGAEVPGAVINAAAWWSLGRTHSSHALAWLLDVVVGTGLGFLFEKCWKLARALPGHLAWGPSRAERRRYVAASIAVVLKSALVWVLAVSIALLVMRLAGWLMAIGMWLNPGPVVLGMFLHAMLLREHGTTRVTKVPMKHRSSRPTRAIIRRGRCRRLSLQLP